MMKFLHLAAPGRNVGDNALIIGMRSLFDGHELLLENVRSTILDAPKISEINKHYDGIVIGGGGLLHSTPSTRAKKTNSSGTLINLDTKNLKHIKKPVIIYGVGYNVFDREVDLCNKARSSILDMINGCVHFSVRNDGSKERLLNFLNVKDLNITEVPDPGLYCKSEPAKYHYLSANKENNIAIQLAADRLMNRFNNEQELLTFVSEIKQFMTVSEHNCWLVPHTPADYDFISQHFSGYKIFPLKIGLQESSVVMGFYEQMRCVIGQRGHANICPFGLNVPIISIVSHPKNIGFMNKIGFSKYAVNVNDKNLCSKLSEMVDSINEGYIASQTNINKQLTEQSKKIVKDIINARM